MSDVVVVGAGIVGAAVAYESARAGAAVTLLDRALPASGVTGDSFAWIGGPGGRDVPDGSRPLHRGVVAGYRRLEAELPGVRVRWTGALVWDDDPRPPVALGPGEHLLDAAQVGRWEPHLSGPPAWAVRRESDGAVDPVATTEALVRGAQDHGARLLVGTAATALVREGRRVVGVRTSAGHLPSRTVVVAAGADAPVLCAPLGVHLPVAPSPALLLRCTGPPGLVRTLLAGPRLEVREAADGVLWVALPYEGETSRSAVDRTARAALRRLTAAFTGSPDVRLLGAHLAWRPMPADGLPVVGPLPGVDGVHVAVLHSGVSLAPVVGRLVATEVVHGARAADLDGVRPGRFAAAGSSGPS